MRAALVTVVLGCGFGALPEAQAVTQDTFYYSNSADACQLSIPTIDTVVAPRATGFRNPGTKGAFVICGFSKMNNLPLISANAIFMSMDGQEHEISCTGVNGLPEFGQTYVAKNVAVPATGHGAIAYRAVDFGSSGSTIPDSDYNFSITCNVPPQVSITMLTAEYNYEIGS